MGQLDAKYPAIEIIINRNNDIISYYMKKSFFIFIILFFQGYLLFAHVGNSNITLEGMAGPYHALINIRPPDVIPGTAQLILYTSSDPGVKITARPVYFYSGKEGAPNPDVLTPVAGQPGQYEGTLWLMDNGSASIQLNFDGPRGKGEMLVPVVAVSTTTKKMPPSIAYMLLALGAFLFILMLTIVSSSVADGITKAGQKISPKIKRTKTIAFLVTGLLCSVFVYGGYSWWRNVAKKTGQFIFKPMHANYTVENSNGANTLNLTIDTADAQRSNWLPYVIPDHGKIMHMFLVSLPGMEAFAHIHPVRTGPVNFSVDLPNIPDGKYLAFADVVYNSGFTETLKDTVVIHNNSSISKTGNTTDSDNSSDISHPVSFGDNAEQNKNITIGGKTGQVYTSADGVKFLLEPPEKNKHYFSGALQEFKFSLWDKNNQPFVPDLYMGMSGHLVIMRDDGNVFSHVHPVGTYSMAAQSRFENRMTTTASRADDPDAVAFRDSVDMVIKKLEAMPEEEREDVLMMEMMAMPGMEMSAGCGPEEKKKMMSMHNMSTGNTVSFPYTFESPGNYRIWVQVKKDGKVYTGVFDRLVK